MQNRWKRLFIITLALLVVTVGVGGVLSFQKISTIETRLESLTAEQSSMAETYAVLRQQINVRAGRKDDGRLFIMPDDPEVAAKVDEIAGEYTEDNKEQWGDYERMSRWVSMHIEYNQDTYIPVLTEVLDWNFEWVDDFWRTPAETLRDGMGDCEDVSALLASMILNYNERRFPVWMVGIATPPPNPKGHIGIAFPVANQQLTIIDPTGKYQSIFPVGWGLSADDVPVALEKWLAHWQEKMPNAYVYTLVSEDTYMEFTSNEEFIQWVYKYYNP